MYISGEENGNPLQYSCLENSMDGGAWWATAHGVTKSRTRLSDFTTYIYIFKYLTAEFSKGRGTRDQIANIHWIIEKARAFLKKHLFLLY